MPLPEDQFQIGDRRCSKCGHVGPLTDFTKDPRYNFGRKNLCTHCWSDQQIPRTMSHRAKRRAIIDAYKDKPCMDCRRRYPPWVMDLDHVSGEKEFPLSLCIARNTPVDLIRSELVKCEVVCSNCHRQRTYERGDIYKQYQTGHRKPRPSGWGDPSPKEYSVPFHAFGEDHFRSKLTADLVRQIRSLHAEGNSFAELGRRFKLDSTTVRNAVKRKTWRHIL